MQVAIESKEKGTFNERCTATSYRFRFRCHCLKIVIGVIASRMLPRFFSTSLLHVSVNAASKDVTAVAVLTLVLLSLLEDCYWCVSFQKCYHCLCFLMLPLPPFQSFFWQLQDHRCKSVTVLVTAVLALEMLPLSLLQEGYCCHSLTLVRLSPFLR